jgi:hypothetical protein
VNLQPQLKWLTRTLAVWGSSGLVHVGFIGLVWVGCFIIARYVRLGDEKEVWFWFMPICGAYLTLSLIAAGTKARRQSLRSRKP